jgi:hypothetical protein
MFTQLLTEASQDAVAQYAAAQDIYVHQSSYLPLMWHLARSAEWAGNAATANTIGASPEAVALCLGKSNYHQHRAAILLTQRFDTPTEEIE